MSEEHNVTPETDSLSGASLQKKMRAGQRLEKASKYFQLETLLLNQDDIVHKMQKILGYNFVGDRIEVVNGKPTPKSIKKILRDADKEVRFFLTEDERALKFMDNVKCKFLEGYNKITPRRVFKKYPIQKIHDAKVFGKAEVAGY